MSSINPNPAPFVSVWQRTNPVFYGKSVARVYAPSTETNPFAHPETLVALNAADPGVLTPVQWKTKVIKVIFNPNSDGRSQIDTIAILGFSLSALNRTGECLGRTTIDAGATGNVDNTTAPQKEVMCSGHGACKPKGCECKGNWDGAACDRCKFGWQGEDCDEKFPLADLPRLQLCSIVMFEDVNEFDGAEIQVRWNVQGFTFKTTRVFAGRDLRDQVRVPAHHPRDAHARASASRVLHHGHARPLRHGGDLAGGEEPGGEPCGRTDGTGAD
eukprot:Sspe_Gene.1197::Locus_405_Transcript_1_3_Confidence_0.714_Length_7052::g.1197::m.1197